MNHQLPISAVPRWSNTRARYHFYDEAARLRQEGYNVQVDHIYPLKGVDVCGLDCEDNLQIVDSLSNSAKNNRLLMVRVYPITPVPMQLGLF